MYHEAEQLIKNRKDDITFADINAHISLILSGCTQQNRYPGGADLKHLITNLIPFAGADYLHVYVTPVYFSGLVSTSFKISTFVFLVLFLLDFVHRRIYRTKNQTKDQRIVQRKNDQKREN